MSGQNAQAPVDVKGVLARALEWVDFDLSICDDENRPDELRQGLRDSIAAVAELIKADQRYDLARRAWEHAFFFPEEVSDEVRLRINVEFEEAAMARAGALARVGGAS